MSPVDVSIENAEHQDGNDGGGQTRVNDEAFGVPKEILGFSTEERHSSVVVDAILKNNLKHKIFILLLFIA